MLGEGDCIDGRYRIYGEKGKGGGGIVYLAEHLALKKQVVLKQIINGSPDMELLRTEVDILKRLRHPALPQVYDFVNVNGNVFTVMEYKVIIFRNIWMQEIHLARSRLLYGQGNWRKY